MSSSLSRLHGKTALITGAGGGGVGGIGRGVALALASEGANVALAVRHRASGEETADLIAREHHSSHVIQCDVSERREIEAAVSIVLSVYGGLDIVVHNAYHRDGETLLALEELTDDRWRVQASVAWDAEYFLARAAFPYLRRSGQGRFITFGSPVGSHGAGMNPVYSAVKGGNRGFVKALAREWAPYNITVNAIVPLAAANPEGLLALGPPVEQFMRNVPFGRFGRPREDIGGAIVAICSDSFSFVTAQSIYVDGGMYTAL